MKHTNLSYFLTLCISFSAKTRGAEIVHLFTLIYPHVCSYRHLIFDGFTDATLSRISKTNSVDH